MTQSPCRQRSLSSGIVDSTVGGGWDGEGGGLGVLVRPQADRISIPVEKSAIIWELDL